MDRRDPTMMRNQPALTTSAGTAWLVVGAITTVLVAGMMTALWLVLGSTLALVMALVTVALFVAMVVVRVAVPPGRQRLFALAVIYIVLVGGNLIAVLVIAFGAEAQVR